MIQAMTRYKGWQPAMRSRWHRRERARRDHLCGGLLARRRRLSVGQRRFCEQAACPVLLIADEFTPASAHGPLHRERHWGPPSFGDDPATDNTFNALVLTLDHPLMVITWYYTPDAEPIPITKLQLHDERSPIGADSFLGKHVEAKGLLAEQVSPSDVTEVTMDLTAIRAVPKSEVPDCGH
ncbi:MAG TPA: hypothetical protein VN668_13510 [Stellaceae bacterium]|nr:hypothetical protein [Stellaceae bacterium]